MCARRPDTDVVGARIAIVRTGTHDTCVDAEIDTAEVHTAEICAAEICAAEVCTAEICAAEVRTAEICAAEVHVAEIHPTEILVARVHAKIARSEIDRRRRITEPIAAHEVDWAVPVALQETSRRPTTLPSQIRQNIRRSLQSAIRRGRA
jgi:hypothetical protein